MMRGLDCTLTPLTHSIMDISSSMVCTAINTQPYPTTNNTHTIITGTNGDSVSHSVPQFQITYYHFHVT